MSLPSQFAARSLTLPPNLIPHITTLITPTNDTEDILDRIEANIEPEQERTITQEIIERIRNEIEKEQQKENIHNQQQYQPQYKTPAKNISAFGNESTAKKLASISTPGENRNKRIKQETPARTGNYTRELETPVTPTSIPASSVITPVHEKFSQRTNKGKVEAIFNGNLNSDYDVPMYLRCSLALISEHSQHYKAFRYAFEKLNERSTSLHKRIATFGNLIKESQGVELFSDASGHSQTPVMTIGRICCDSNGKLNDKSVTLEMSRDVGYVRARLNLSDISAYTIFPGQIVAMEGSNSTGLAFDVKRFVELPPLEPQFTTLQRLHEFNHTPSGLNSAPMSVMIGAGPFSFSDTGSYEPMESFMKSVIATPPDILIITGPIVDANQEEICPSLSHLTPLEIVQQVLVSRLRMLLDKSPHTQIVLIPSVRDVFHQWVIFPQPGYAPRKEKKEFLAGLDAAQRKNVHMYPNPSTFSINEITFSISSSDILFDLSMEEISRGQTVDRMTRLATHLIEQRSFYPLFPSASKANVEWTRWTDFQIPLMPDILIVPSEHKPMVKTINYKADDTHKCLVINPGTIAKKTVGGTFAKMVIHPFSKETLLSETLEPAESTDVTMAEDAVQIKAEPTTGTADVKDSSNLQFKDYEVASACSDRCRIEVLRV